MGPRLGWLLPLLAVALFAMVPWLGAPQFYLHLLILTLMYATLASSWNIMGGYTGYVSLGHGVFFGLGAYTVGIIVMRTGISPWAAMPAAALVVVLLGLAVGWVSLRTRGSSFVIVTIALVYIVQVLILNLRDLTRGAQGINLPRPDLPVEVIKFPFYYAMLALLVVTVLLSWYVRGSKFGLGLMAIREDEEKAEAVGIDTALYKILAFALSVLPVGLAGGIFAYYITFIDPVFFVNILVGASMILMAVLGGRGTLWGPVLGAFIMVPLQQLLVVQAIGNPIAHLAIFGGALLLVVLLLPRGIIPSLGDLVAARQAGTGLTGASAAGAMTPEAESAQVRPKVGVGGGQG